MYDIDEIELRRLDITILLVFLNLMRFGKATDVAHHMGLTQSSISHSIRRLRDAFGDPLFLRTPRGMAPTAVARGLEPRIRSIVETLSDAMTRKLEFTAAEAQGTFRIGAYDNEMMTLIPDLIRRVRERAPGLTISVLPVGRRRALDALDNRDIDLALGFIWDLPKDFEATELYRESYRVICRRNHPFAATIGALETYCGLDHLVVSPGGDLSGIVDQELEKLGKRRHVVASLPLFLPVISLVATSDLIATVPSRLVRSQAGLRELHDAEPPIAIRSFPVSAIRHIREARNPLHEWFIDLLQSPEQLPSG